MAFELPRGRDEHAATRPVCCANHIVKGHSSICLFFPHMHACSSSGRCGTGGDFQRTGSQLDEQVKGAWEIHPMPAAHCLAQLVSLTAASSLHTAPTRTNLQGCQSYPQDHRLASPLPFVSRPSARPTSSSHNLDRCSAKRTAASLAGPAAVGSVRNHLDDFPTAQGCLIAASIRLRVLPLASSKLLADWLAGLCTRLSLD